MGVPSMYAAIARLKDASADDFKTIYAMFSGGEPLPAALREAFQARFGVPLLEAYGMTETSLAIALNTPRRNKPGSVGTPIPGMEVRIVDDDGQRPVAGGQEGEVWVQGPMVMKGYNNLPDETAAALTARRLLQDRRPGQARRRRVPLHHRAQEGPDHRRGREGRPAGDRGDVLAPTRPSPRPRSSGKKDPSRGEVVVAFVIAARRGSRPTPRSCGSSAGSRAWPSGRCRARSESSRTCRARRPVRC